MQSFLKFKINLKNFYITIPYALSNLQEKTNFQYDQELYKILETEITLRRTAFDISPPLHVQDEKEINYQSGQDPLTEENKKVMKNQNKFVYDDKVFHSEHGFGYVVSVEHKSIEVFFQETLKKIKVNQNTLKRF